MSTSLAANHLACAQTRGRSGRGQKRQGSMQGQTSVFTIRTSTELHSRFRYARGIRLCVKDADAAHLARPTLSLAFPADPETKDEVWVNEIPVETMVDFDPGRFKEINRDSIICCRTEIREPEESGTSPYLIAEGHYIDFRQIPSDLTYRWKTCDEAVVSTSVGGKVSFETVLGKTVIRVDQDHQVMLSREGIRNVVFRVQEGDMVEPGQPLVKRIRRSDNPKDVWIVAQRIKPRRLTLNSEKHEQRFRLLLEMDEQASIYAAGLGFPGWSKVKHRFPREKIENLADTDPSWFPRLYVSFGNDADCLQIVDDLLNLGLNQELCKLFQEQQNRALPVVPGFEGEIKAIHKLEDHNILEFAVEDGERKLSVPAEFPLQLKEGEVVSPKQALATAFVGDNGLDNNHPHAHLLQRSFMISQLVFAGDDDWQDSCCLFPYEIATSMLDQTMGMVWNRSKLMTWWNDNAEAFLPPPIIDETRRLVFTLNAVDIDLSPRARNPDYTLVSDAQTVN